MNRRHLLQSGLGVGLGMLLSPAAVCAQSAPADDIGIVRDLLMTLHPGLYRYLSPRALDHQLDELERQWRRNESLDQRYLALSRFLAQLRCGHSYANFFNQSDAVKAALFDRPTRLPFTFRWIGDAMVVTGNQSSAGGRQPVWLPVGSVIRAVDGVPVEQIYRRLRPFARVDGHNEGKARALLSVSGSDSIEFFDIFHGLVFGAPPSGQFNIHFRAPATSGDVWADVPALTLTERQAFTQAQSPGDDRDAAQWQWTTRADGIAVLRMDGWALYNSRWDWRAWLEERLDSLGNARGLIIDIRRNEGGLDCGDPILARLSSTPLRRTSGNRLVRYQSVPARLRPYLNTWDNSFYDWGAAVERHDERFYRLRRDDADDVIAPSTRPITQPVAVLTSADNSSATFAFAALIKRNRLCALVGETTGGNQRGINGGAFFFARLPQSGIEFDIPLIGYFPSDVQPDGGIAPDIMVTPTPQSIAAGSDPALERAVQHCLATPR